GVYRAFDRMARLLQTTHHELDDMEAAHLGVPFNAWPNTDQKNAQTLAHLIDDIGMQLYFASGAYGAKTQGGRMPLSPEEQQRFYDEAGGILMNLQKWGLQVWPIIYLKRWRLSSLWILKGFFYG